MTTRPPCAVDGCIREAMKRSSVCSMHAGRKRRTGSYGGPDPIPHSQRNYPSGPRPKAPSKPCKVDGCENAAKSYGWCPTHYGRWKRTGDPLLLSEPKPLRDRVLAKVEVLDNGCWRWTGRVSQTGYGTLSVGNQPTAAYRIAYEEFVGPIPEGMQLDHLCHTRDASCEGGPSCVHRACVNPEHLEPVTQRENSLRSQSAWAKNARKTHCKWGHEFTPENTLIDRGNRSCRCCKLARTRRWKEDQRKAAS